MTQFKNILMSKSFKLILWILHCLGVPQIVCLCGSSRFYVEFQAANLRETLAYRIVLSIGCDTKSDADIFGMSSSEVDHIKQWLDWLHKRKIDMSDEILVLNKDGYIGSSTRSEIEHAYKRQKHIRYLEEVAA